MSLVKLLVPAVVLCALTAGCQKPAAAPVAPATKPGELAAEWKIPALYQGEWREKLDSCGDDKNPTRLILTVDHMTLGPNDGPIQASSITSNHLTVVADLKDGPAKAPEGQSLQRAFTFDISPDQNTLAIDIAEKPISFVRCPAKVG